MIDLSQTYRRIGHPWTHEELAARYATANRRGGQLLNQVPDAAPQRPIALLATAIPAATTLSVTIHLVHAIPEGALTKLADALFDTAETTAADVLHRCHRALELDGHAHDYTADEWQPVIYDAAAPPLESSQLDQDPPSVVRQTQDAVRWLSSSITCLDEDSRETPAALTDTLARLLVVCVFADSARTRSESRPPPRRCLCGAWACAAAAVVGRSPCLRRVASLSTCRGLRDLLSRDRGYARAAHRRFSACSQSIRSTDLTALGEAICVHRIDAV